MKLFQSPTRQWILLSLLLVTLVYACVRFESGMLYHPNQSDPSEYIALSPLKERIQTIHFQAEDGTRLQGWFIPPKKGFPTLVFAHGNAGNMGHRYPVIRAFTERGYGFLAFDYRGYGLSEGSPSEIGLYQDFDAASRYLVKKQHIPYTNQIAMGESLGGGVAIEAAARLPYKAVLVYATYTSIPDVAHSLRAKNRFGILGILPLESLVQQRFDSLSRIRDLKMPILIAHGDQDRLIPVEMGKQLFHQAASPHKQLLIIEGAGHNDLFSASEDRLVNALDQLLTTQPSKKVSGNV